MEHFDATRESIIKTSRDALKSSKKAIYATHRGDTKGATALLKDAKKTLATVTKLAGTTAGLQTIGALTEAQEEFAEASFYLAFAIGEPLPSPSDLDVRPDQYLAGLCDLCGELTRAAINAAIAEDYRKTKAIKDLVGNIYAELMKFDFRNSPLRRKFDSIKYGLEKLEDTVLDLKLRDRL